MATIGFVGVGNMGAPMAQNLLNAGHRLKVHDIDPEAQGRMVQLGAIEASSETVAAEVDAVITMLPAGRDVCDVLLGDALLDRAAKGTLFIDSSSIEIDTARELTVEAHVRGMEMVDAPVSGGVVKAADGTLTIMVGGEEAEFAHARPILDAMGEAIIHAGTAGNGQAAKICNNMILGITMIGVSEAFTLAERVGLDLNKAAEICAKSSGGCWVIDNYHPCPGVVEGAPASNGYKPGFSSALMLKDLGLSQSAARNSETFTPLGAMATRLYQQFVDSGADNVDFSGIIRMLALSKRPSEPQ
jgi:3-hydroxyisobutyrate dehydrogenase